MECLVFFPVTFVLLVFLVYFFFTLPHTRLFNNTRSLFLLIQNLKNILLKYLTIQVGAFRNLFKTFRVDFKVDYSN